MIQNLNELRRFIKADQVYYKTSLKSWLLGDQSFYIGQYLKFLRLIEYYKNLEKSWIRYLLLPFYIVVLIFFRKYSYKLGGFQIGFNTCGPGIKIYHYGFIIINGKAKIGSNFCIQPGCVVGRTEAGVPIIGDNFYMAPNSSIMGNVHIGDNVTIAQNSVVVKDVPDNCVVGGNAAKIIKYKS